MLWMWLAGVGSWCHACQAQLLHQALYPFAVDPMTQSTQVLGHAPCAIKWMPCVLFIKQLQQQALIVIYCFLLAFFMGIDD